MNLARCLKCGFDSDDAYEAAAHLRLHEGETVRAGDVGPQHIGRKVGGVELDWILDDPLYPGGASLLFGDVIHDLTVDDDITFAPVLMDHVLEAARRVLAADGEVAA
jgi:hypothetical protein